MKQCNKCNKILPDGEFRRRTDNNKLYNQCKNCEIEYRKDYYQKYWKEKSEYRKKHKKHKKNYDKKYRQCHLEKKKEWDKKYYQKTRQKQLAYWEKYRNEHQDKIKEYRKTHKKEIRETERVYQQKHLERINKKRRDNYQKNKEKRLAINRKRYLKKKELFEEFALGEWKQKIKETNDICQICNKPYKLGGGLSIDHTPPISKAPIGFRYSINDVTPMCKRCNSSKNNRV